MRASAFVVAASAVLLLSGCPDSDDGPPLFSPDDLAGVWHETVIFHGAAVADGTAPGWSRARLSVDAAGAVTYLAYTDSVGGTTPPPGAVSWTIDRAGFVRSTSALYPQLEGKMNGGKTFVAATATQGGLGSLRLLQKEVPEAVFGDAQLAGATFAYHELRTGGAPDWEHGTATTDSARLLSLGTRVAMAGAQPDVPGVGTLAVASDGTVTLDGDATFGGTLSPDGAFMVAVRTEDAGTHVYALTFLARSGMTFAQPDLAGDWGVYTALAGVQGGFWGWTHGTVRADAEGTVTFTRWQTNAGVANPLPPVAVALSASGILTTPAGGASFHGVMTSGKDVVVRTMTTITPNVYASLGVWVR